MGRASITSLEAPGGPQEAPACRPEGVSSAPLDAGGPRRAPPFGEARCSTWGRGCKAVGQPHGASGGARGRWREVSVPPVAGVPATGRLAGAAAGGLPRRASPVDAVTIQPTEAGGRGANGPVVDGLEQPARRGPIHDRVEQYPAGP